MFSEDIQEASPMPAKLRRNRRVKLANSEEGKEWIFNSIKNAYGIESVISPTEFVEGRYFNSPLEYIRESVAKYFKSTPSIINLGLCRLNRLIEEIKKNGDVSQVFSTIFYGDSVTSLCLHIRSGVSEVFLFADDIKYFDKTESKSFSMDQFSEEDYVGDKVAIAYGPIIFFRQGDEFGHYLASKICRSSRTKDILKDSFIEMIVATQSGLELKSIILEKPSSFDLATNYGEHFTEYHEKLLNRFKSRNKGIVMFHGPPGTGKTHYIRSLIPEFLDMDKRVVLIPKHVLSQMESPQFNSFMLDVFTNENTIFIIEDAESIITKREGVNGHRSELVSTILNITDGILNDIFNIQILLTFNTEISSIDDALLRKGRLISKYEFGLLSKPQALKLANSIGVSLRDDKQSYSLAEVYGMKDFDEDEVLINQNISKPKTFVGF
jgi:hypothetical protein